MNRCPTGIKCPRWVKLRKTQHEQMSSALLPRTDFGLAAPKHDADRMLRNVMRVISASARADAWGPNRKCPQLTPRPTRCGRSPIYRAPADNIPVPTEVIALAQVWAGCLTLSSHWRLTNT